jgi:hypothetical protein
MAERCAAGEFGGSSWRAAATPECVALGIERKNIDYHLAKINTADSASRAANRARVEAETAQAEVEMMPVKYIFVERKGSAPASAAVSLVVERLANELSPQVACAAISAREEAAAAYQAELEAKTAETEILVKQLKKLEEKEARRAADSARVAETAEKEIRDLKAKLELERERSQSLEAKAEATTEARR